MPAVAIADGSITSPFLALLGRSARATGMENERNNKPTPAQWLYLLNSTEVQRKLEQGTNLQAVISFGSRKPPEIIEGLYLTILSRFPTPEEVQAIEDYGKRPPVKPAAGGKGGQAVKPGTTNSAPTGTLAAGSGSTNPAVPRTGPLGSLGRAAKAPDKPAAVKSREDWIDIAWSLMNSEEFLYRH
jgi:hypothetical protein